MSLKKMKFKKKPIVIDAWQWNPEGQEDIPFPDWLNDALIGHQVFLEGTSFLFKGEVLSQYQRAEAGDWIIRGMLGDLHPCKDVVFQQLYERVEE